MWCAAFWFFFVLQLPSRHHPPVAAGQKRWLGPVLRWEPRYRSPPKPNRPFHFNRKKNNHKRCIDIHSQLWLGYSFYEGDISMFSFSQVMIFPFIESQTRQRNDHGRLYDRQISRVLQTYPSQHHHNTVFLYNENKKHENSQFVVSPSVFRCAAHVLTTISLPVVKYSKLMEIEILHFKQHNKRVLPHFKHWFSLNRVLPALCRAVACVTVPIPFVYTGGGRNGTMTLWHFDFEPLLKEKTKLITHAEVPVSLFVF